MYDETNKECIECQWCQHNINLLCLLNIENALTVSLCDCRRFKIELKTMNSAQGREIFWFWYRVVPHHIEQNRSRIPLILYDADHSFALLMKTLVFCCHRHHLNIKEKLMKKVIKYFWNLMVLPINSTR